MLDKLRNYIWFVAVKKDPYPYETFPKLIRMEIWADMEAELRNKYQNPTDDDIDKVCLKFLGKAKTSDKTKIKN